MIEPTDTSNLPTETDSLQTEEKPADEEPNNAETPATRKIGFAAKTGADRARMAAIGRLGGFARRKKPVAQPSDEQAAAPPTVPSDEPCDDKEASREK